MGEQKGFRNDMDLLDSRRQSKDQEIIDNIDKNFEGELQVKIKSRHFFFFPSSSSRFCMPLFFIIARVV